jgi:sugar phosphate isomerase/epimerase
MQLGIFAKTFAGSTPDVVLAAARRAGYAAVQYNMACSGLASMPDAIERETAEQVATQALAHRVKVVAVSGTYNMIHPDLAVRAAGHARLETIAQACAAMGTRLITLCTGTRDPVDMWHEHPDNRTPAAWSDLVASMEIAIGIADRYGVDLGIEPELANVIDSAERAKALIDEMGSARLRIVLDPANLFDVLPLSQQRATVAAAIELLADRISLAHAKDRHADGRFATAGTGVLDYAHYLKCLQEVGFEGPLITHGLSESEAPAVAQYLSRVCAELGMTLEAGPRL